jgi:hypothetical protein
MSQQNAETLEYAPVFLLVHTRVEGQSASKHHSNPRDKWARYALVVDVESTTDTR